MLRKTVSGLMLALMLIGMLTLAFNIQSVKTEPATIIVPDDYSTIQEAINNAFDGDTIYVKAGTYYENVVVNKTILLIGESKENTMIDGKDIGKVLELTVDGILVSNFTITNGEVGIHITNSHRHMIRNNIIARNIRGATGTYYTYTTYENNIVRENEYGLDFGQLGGLSSSSNFAIGNEVYDNFVGIYVSASEGDNAIENNLIYNNNIGIVLDNTRNNNVTGNTLANNTREGDFKYGVYSRNAIQNNIEGNIFIQNNVGVFMDRGYCNMIQKNNFTSNSYGVYLTFNESLTYTGWSFDNQIVKNYFLNNTYGIYSNIGAAVFINSQFNTTISENKLKNNLYGIFLYLSPVNRILENTISLNDYGIHIELSSGNYLINNSITQNTVNGITLHLASDNSLISNNMSKCDVGITLSLSSSNLICRNVIANNNIGVKTELSNDNTIYNNDFVRNVQQVTTDGLSSNKWNTTYPYGGNYWSDYVGADIYCGPHQNETGSDGIGDTSYIVDINELFDTYNIDYYPLMKPCIVKCYAITIISGVEGTTKPSPGTYTYTAWTELNVTAIPNVSYSFDYWLLDGEIRTENPITIIMDANYTLEAHFIDDVPPEIGDPIQGPPPDNVQPFQNVTVTVNVTDYGTGIKNVTLWYKLANDTEWDYTTMLYNESLGLYEGTIPSQPAGTWVKYKVLAYDVAGNVAVEDNLGEFYTYQVQTVYKLTITATTGGTTNPSSGTYNYTVGTELNVTAIPNVGYSFNHWLLDGNMRTENPITVTMDSNHTLEAYFADNIPPEISEPRQDPPANNVQPFQNVTVTVNVTDYGTGIKNVTLWYSIDNGTNWTPLNMIELPIPSGTGITYEATIQGCENCTWVTYKIVAYDNAANNATKDNLGYYYKYHVIPEFPSTTILPPLMLTTLIVTVLLKKKNKTKLQLP